MASKTSSFSTDSKGKIHIPDPKLRAILAEKGNIVEELQSEGYSSEYQEKLNRSAVYSPVALIQDAKEYEYYDAAVDEDEDSQILAPYLVFLHKLHPKLIKQAQDNLESGAVSGDDVCLLLQKGSLARIEVRGTTAIAVVDSIETVETMIGPIKFASCGIVSHNGKGFVRGTVNVRIPNYETKRPVQDFSIRPLTASDDLKTYEERGKRTAEKLLKPFVAYHKGNMVRVDWSGDTFYEATGRVMVDVSGMQMVDNSYNHYWGIARHRDENTALDIEELSASDFICMSPFVYGFSFRTKVWGEMLLENLSDVNFRKDSFDQLVLDSDIKKLIRILVSSPSKGRDFVDGKGGGCIFLLEGEPGCGKTFTAEATAEVMQRPLYSVSVGELGTSADDLDQRLRLILEIASRWNAVLLLDECDIFLEARSTADIERNAMVGVFLRLLEYYPGILFLTTNRSEQLDPAVYSRISLPIHYPRLSESSLARVLQNHLTLNGLNWDYPWLCSLVREAHDLGLNGRQIKNCVRQACAYADHENRKALPEDLQYMLKMLERFAKQSSKKTS